MRTCQKQSTLRDNLAGNPISLSRAFSLLDKSLALAALWNWNTIHTYVVLSQIWVCIVNAIIEYRDDDSLACIAQVPCCLYVHVGPILSDLQQRVHIIDKKMCVNEMLQYNGGCNGWLVFEYFFTSMSTTTGKCTRVGIQAWVSTILYLYLQSSTFLWVWVWVRKNVLKYEKEHEYSNSIVVVEYFFMSTSVSIPTL